MLADDKAAVCAFVIDISWRLLAQVLKFAWFLSTESAQFLASNEKLDKMQQTWQLRPIFAV